MVESVGRTTTKLWGAEEVKPEQNLLSNQSPHRCTGTEIVCDLYSLIQPTKHRISDLLLLQFFKSI